MFFSYPYILDLQAIVLCVNVKAFPCWFSWKFCKVDIDGFGQSMNILIKRNFFCTSNYYGGVKNMVRHHPGVLGWWLVLIGYLPVRSVLFFLLLLLLVGSVDSYLTIVIMTLIYNTGHTIIRIYTLGGFILLPFFFLPPSKLQLKLDDYYSMYIP